MLKVLMIIKLMIILALGSMLLVSCNSGSGVSTATNDSLTIAKVATMQLTGSDTNRILYLPISNNGSLPLTLANYTLQTNQATTSEFSADNNCQQIPAASSCVVKIVLSDRFVAPNGNFALTIQAYDNSKNQYIATDVINYQTLTTIKSINLESAINYAINPRNNGYLAIPIVLDQNIVNPVVLLNHSNHNIQIYCDLVSSYNYCTIIVNLTKLEHGTDSALLTINANGLATVNSQISFNVNTQGNLVVAGLPAVITPANADNSVLISVLNDGNQAATLIGESITATFSIESDTCVSVLASGSSCSFKIKAQTRQFNSSQNVSLNYVTNGQNKSISFVVNYYATNYSNPQISITAVANWLGIVMNTSITGTYTFTNSGNLPMTYLGIANPSMQSSVFSESSGYFSGNKCINGSSVLAPGASCSIQLLYNPTTSGLSGNLWVNPNFSYTSSTNQTLNYNNTSLLTPYSSSGNYYMYFGNLDSANKGNAMGCQFDPSTGALSICGIKTGVGPAATVPQTFLQYTTNRFFVANSYYFAPESNTNTIWTCTMASDGSLSCAALSTSPVKIGWPTGMAINNGYLYITNRQNAATNQPQIVRCSYNSVSGTLSACSGYSGTYGGMTLDTPYGIGIYNNVAYISDMSNKLFACPINSNGDFYNCQSLNIVVTSGASGSGIINPHAIAIRNGIIYITSFTSGKIYVCTIGQWSNCYGYLNTALIGSGGPLGITTYGNYIFISDQNSGITPYPIRFTLDHTGLFYDATAQSQTALGSYASVIGAIGIGYGAPSP